MKRTVLSLFGAVLLLSGTLYPLPSAMAAPKEALLYLQVQQTKLRSQPQFWSTPVSDLSYGAALTTLGAAPSDKSWIKVKYGDKEGYVHVSSVTSRKIVLKSAGNVDPNVDPGSIVLAGKGFNKQVEGNYAASRGLNYKSVDLVEANRVEPAEEIAFLESGGLATK